MKGRGTTYQLVRQDGAVFHIGPSGVSIGRHRTNEIIISDGNVSRQHARVFERAGQVWVRDEQSASGTFINGRRVSGQQELRPGDALQIGRITFRLSAASGRGIGLPGRAGGSRSASAQRRNTGVIFTIMATVVVVLGLFLVIALGNRRASPTEELPRPEPASGEAATGQVTVPSGGASQITLYDGVQATLRFVGERGEEVGTVEANYVSDETGLTVVAASDDGEHFPTIRYFPSQGASSGVPKLAALARQNQTYNIDLSRIHFDGDVYFETTDINLEHLEQLPANMDEWELRNTTRENLCSSIAWGATAFHGTIAIIHGVASPVSGVPHATWAIGEAVVIHAGIEKGCEVLLISDPAEEYLELVNEELNYHILLEGSRTSSVNGYAVGQVVDAQTHDGIPGASVTAGNASTSTLSNGWYYLPVPWGAEDISAQATGFAANSIPIDFEMGTGQAYLLDAIPLQPSEQTERLGRGDVKVTLRWFTKDDLDLHVVDPQGHEIFYNNPTSPSGGELDVDSNAGCNQVTSTPVENIYWPAGGAPNGSYAVSVVYYANCGSASAVSYEVTISVDGYSTSYSGSVSRVGQENAITSFSR